MLILLAAALPVLYWQAGPNTASALKQAGITQIAVPASNVSSWQGVTGVKVQVADIQKATKLPPPGIAFRMNVASASRVPWINSNAWRFIRQPDGYFYYDVDARTAPLAAAEAFCYNAHAIIQTGESALEPLAKMLNFLAGIPRADGQPVADIGFVDDDSPIDGEVMNLLVRDNLLFRIIRSPQPGFKLIVQIGTKEYPRDEANNPDVMEHKIRANLTDAKRTIRIFGTSVVVARVTADSGQARIQLLNYGASRGMQVGAFRVHILGRYTKAQLHSFDTPADQVSDFSFESGATEFTVPELKIYAAIDLTK